MADKRRASYQARLKVKPILDDKVIELAVGKVVAEVPIGRGSSNSHFDLERDLQVASTSGDRIVSECFQRFLQCGG